MFTLTSSILETIVSCSHSLFKKSAAPEEKATFSLMVISTLSQVCPWRWATLKSEKMSLSVEDIRVSG
mgnify:CR=1 FL=1